MPESVTSVTPGTGHALARFLFRLGFVATSALFCTAGFSQSVAPSPESGNTSLENTASYQPSYSGQLSRVQVLIRANVLDLAQKILETQGPPALPNADWINWERQLWSLYESRKKWSKLYQRLSRIPPAFPASIHFEADIKAISASIETDQGAQARRLIRKHLASGLVSEVEKKNLREKTIESFLNDGFLREATTAMEHYQHDYRSQEDDWLLLSARVYLQINRPDQAINLLAPLTSPAARLLRIQARLQNRSMTSSQAIGAASTLLANNADSLNELDALSLMISASIESASSIARVGFLERYLIAKSGNASRSHSYHEYTVEDLFDAYSEIALKEANRLGLLIGDHVQWLDYVDRSLLDNNVIRKSFYAYLCVNVTNPKVRRRAVDGYVNTLIGSGNTDLILETFGSTGFLGELTMSADIGLYLSNDALEKGNVRLAAAVNNGLTEIPSGMRQEDWILHVARISIIAGEYDKGAERLSQWIQSYSSLTPEQTDKVLQPVFDLQKVKQHKRALTLLHLVNDRASSDRHRREIAYWLAESYQETRQFLQAADYFLYSALQKANGFDQWGESARFRAAESLVQANQVSDARALLEGLLDRATEESRKNSLKQKLQQMNKLRLYKVAEIDQLTELLV